MIPARRIVRREPAAIPADYPADLHPVLARLYAARGITSGRELRNTLDGLPPYHGMVGIERAVRLLAHTLERDERILVVGDFDADGATSTAVAVRALRAMGAQHIDYLVPNRFEFGYGLTPAIVEVALERDPRLLITVDNGIASVEGVARARAAGVKVLVTDHHLPGNTLPPADAIVDPQLNEAGWGRALAGVGVIFYVMLALRGHLRQVGWFERKGLPDPNLAQVLDLVALGTVADVVPLDHLNRILVSQGIARIRKANGCAGIEALLEVAGRDQRHLTAADLGFVVGPRLNAAGRLQDMTLGIDCLLSDDRRQALRMAQELDALNRERRAIEQQMREQAIDALQGQWLEEAGEDRAGRTAPPVSLCLYDPGWHEGVIGILASRIKDRYHCPVVVLTDAADGMLKGSARSVAGFHMRDALDAIATRHPDLLSRFGGHAMAAGLTLRREDLTRFERALEQEAQRRDGEGRAGLILTDGELTAEEAQLELAVRLQTAGPWGSGFPEPLFDGIFEVVQWRLLKERHLKLLLRWPNHPRVIDGLIFHADLERWSGQAEWVRLAYRLSVDRYRDQERLFLIIEHCESVHVSPVS